MESAGTGDISCSSCWGGRGRSGSSGLAEAQKETWECEKHSVFDISVLIRMDLFSTWNFSLSFKSNLVIFIKICVICDGLLVLKRIFL